jgi:hypothetical protein
MTNPGSQPTTAENNNPSAERFGSGEDVVQNMAATAVGVDYPTVAFSVGGENEVWQQRGEAQQGQTEWIPGFGKMVSSKPPDLEKKKTERELGLTSAGSPGTTRRLELLFEDAKGHLRGHHHGRLSTTAADAEPT